MSYEDHRQGSQEKPPRHSSESKSESISSESRVTQVRKYRTTDGEEYDSMEDAVDHQIYLDKKDLVAEFLKDRIKVPNLYWSDDFNGNFLDVDDLLDFLLRNREILVELLR